MTAWQIGMAVVAVIALFWMLGAYNRLVSLRNAVGAAWRAVDEALTARRDAIAALQAALREPLAAEAASLDALSAAEARVAQAARSIAGQVAPRDAVAALVRAEVAFGPACDRVRALAETDATVRHDSGVQEALASLRDLAPRLDFARQTFNASVQAYNEALAQWPTRALVRLYGFAAGGSL